MCLPLITIGRPIMQEFITQFGADYESLQRRHSISGSPMRMARLSEFLGETEKNLQAMPFDQLPRDEQVDWKLMVWLVARQQDELATEAAGDAAAAKHLEFSKALWSLLEPWQLFQKADPEKSASALTEIKLQAEKDSAEVREKGCQQTAGLRALKRIRQWTNALERWYGFYSGYDPLFTWWCQRPQKDAKEALDNLTKAIRENGLKFTPGKPEPIVGEAIGEEALLREIKGEMIPYSPQELIAIAAKEMEWCKSEMLRASRDLKCGDDWKKALELTKNQYVKPGDQPSLIRDLAIEAIDYLKKNDLLTIPTLAEETWRMSMMSPERQKVSPFFLGGEEIIVSFPTDEMSQNEKLMSLKSNNIHFARATVHHELIPGHHMQQFMNARYRPYRGLFSTPFWVEGWALYWEMVLWDRGFAKSPENRIGMLFWRMHRCARIYFSLNFHLGKMTAEECIDYLVENVGHERSTAEGEVRRSIAGDYPPLYQAAYMLGALQIRQLRKELVEGGKMKEKAFHDAILQQNAMPISILREALGTGKLKRDLPDSWRFYPGVP